MNGNIGIKTVIWEIKLE